MGAAGDFHDGRIERREVTAAKKRLAKGRVSLQGDRLYAARASDPLTEAMELMFFRLREDRAYEYGHGGYSGTFAEKGDVKIYRLTANLTATQWRRLTDMLVSGFMRWDRNGRQVKRTPTKPEMTVLTKLGLTPHDITIMHEIFDDKWGPALAVVTPDRRFWVGGSCSS